MYLGYQLDKSGVRFIAMVANRRDTLEKNQLMKFIDIQETTDVYVLYDGKYMTDAERARAVAVDNIKNRIRILHQKLSETDYLAMKYAEGLMTDKQYQPIRSNRMAWRREIDELKAS